MASPRRSPRPRRVPQRTCVACREVLSKRTLVRLVRTKDGTEIDPTGKRPGRGAYLHDRRSCWETALKDATILERALKTTLTPEERERLRAYSLTLPE